MCGILGKVDWESSIGEAVFLQMLASLVSRGPDSSGIRCLEGGHVLLGHTRLSIIDLSASGQQPMCNETGDVWIVYNGEIYNFVELRRKLIRLGHEFRSKSDTEVVVHAYEEWGHDCVKRLNGIFAFGIWDSRNRSLFLARDRIGVKPLYYARQQGRLWFASVPRAIVADQQFRREVDREAFQQYLTFGYVPWDQAIFCDMRKLPPAHFAVFKKTGCEIQRYWEPPLEQRIHRADEAVDLVRSQVRRSIKSQLVSDVDVGTFLSGGLDSSIVTQIASDESNSPIMSFNIGFDEPERDERTFARLAAQSAKVELHEAVLDESTASELMPEVFDAYDEPFAGTSSIPTYFVCQQANKHGLKVVLAGDGGDELFAGYTRYDKQRRYVNRTYRRRIRDFIKRTVYGGQMPPSALDYFFRFHCRIDVESQRQILGENQVYVSPSEMSGPMSMFYRGDLPALTAVRLVDLQVYLPDHVLCKVDRASMAQGVEVRVPILDHELVELAFQIDDGIIFGSGGKKSILRSAAEPWLPTDLLSERKQGFNLPLRTWSLRNCVKFDPEFLIDGSLVGHGVIDADGVREVCSTGNESWWPLFVAEHWARRWLESDSSGALHHPYSVCGA
jgi:asparagine synthase (glutamine-hydrolysing)